MSVGLRLTGLQGIAEVEPGHDLAELIVQALEAEECPVADGDLIAVCQKIVSKAEGRYVELADVQPSARAIELATRCRRDARLVELVLAESSEVLRCEPRALITRHRLGFVVANAAIDQSNLGPEGERALLLPVDPDASAAGLRQALRLALGVDVAVLITDSFGRPFRIGVCGVAIGSAGLNALQDLRGGQDRAGRQMQVTQVAIADQLAAAATLIMGEADEGRPVVVISGLPDSWRVPECHAHALVRPEKEDMFR